VAGLSAPASEGDRFANWPRAAAMAALVGFAVLLALAAITAPKAAKPVAVRTTITNEALSEIRAKDKDLLLYKAIAERVGAGDNYYEAATEEQRTRNYPVRPGLAVRLPTLALLTGWLGNGGMIALGVALALGVFVAWWRRFGTEPGASGHRAIPMLLLVIGTGLALKPQYLYQHEVWAGLLLALSFGLHRPGKWLGAWLAAALALAIREHALPFVLLAGALAAWRRDWREALAWAALVGLFAAGVALHLAEVSQYVLPSDRPSPPWLVFRGLEGWTSNIVGSSILWRLPPELAAVVALLPLIGWAGWRSSAGLFGTLLHAGYGAFFMLAGRENNFYWALIVIPTWFVGLAFMPRALMTLTKAALGKT